MVIKTSDKKRDDIFFKAISSVLDRDGLLIDFKGTWFEWYRGYITRKLTPGEVDPKEKVGNSRFVEVEDWNNYREFSKLFWQLMLKMKKLI